MRINNNTLATTANNHLTTIGNNSAKSISKLSSGYKINKASDDAAGMAISQKMQVQIRGLDRANNNAGDGVSLIQTAEGALNEVHSVLTRMRELTVQAANETYDETDASSIQAEIDQLNEEINRIAKDTEFNGNQLIDGSSNRRAYSLVEGVTVEEITDGVEAQKYSLNITAVGTQAISNPTAAGTFATVADTITASEEGEITVNGMSVSIYEGETIKEAYEKLRDAFDKIDIDVYPTQADLSTEEDISAAKAFAFRTQNYGSDETVNIASNNTLLNSKLGITNNDIEGTDGKATLITTTGFSTTATVKANGNEFEITDKNGFSMKLQVEEGIVAPGVTDITVLSAGKLVLQIGSDQGEILDVTIPEVTSDTLGTDRVNVFTHGLASKSMAIIDDAVAKVSSIRSKLGAYQNRLEHTMSNLDVAEENLTSAVSRIMDTDIAEEMSQYTQYNVLSQVSVEMLAKANAKPESILQLLQ